MGTKVIPRIKGIVTWYISPHEQRVFSDWYDSKFVMTKIYRKVTENTDFVPGFLMFVGVLWWGKKENDKEHRSHWY